METICDGGTEGIDYSQSILLGLAIVLAIDSDYYM